jgi:hypothetical protein
VLLYCLGCFIFGEASKVGGNEISINCFVFNVCSRVSIFIYDFWEYLNVGIIMGSINN